MRSGSILGHVASELEESFFSASSGETLAYSKIWSLTMPLRSYAARRARRQLKLMPNASSSLHSNRSKPCLLGFGGFFCSACLLIARYVV